MKVKTSKVTRIGLLIDESGSMGSVKKDTIGSVNKFINDQKTVNGKANITIAAFNDKYKVIVDDIDIQEVQEISNEDYEPSGFTALYDSLMNLILSLEKTGAKTVIIAVMTDGYENKSIEYKLHDLKLKIEEKQKAGWQIVFLAADLDATAYAGSMGVNLNHTRGFTKSASGLDDAAVYLCSCATSYRSSK